MARRLSLPENVNVEAIVRERLVDFQPRVGAVDVQLGIGLEEHNLRPEAVRVEAIKVMANVPRDSGLTSHPIMSGKLLRQSRGENLKTAPAEHAGIERRIKRTLGFRQRPLKREGLIKNIRRSRAVESADAERLIGQKTATIKNPATKNAPRTQAL